MNPDVTYEIGDEVVVDAPNGQVWGKINSVIPNYAWSGETKYSVHGNEFVTITSARTMTLKRPVKNSDDQA